MRVLKRNQLIVLVVSLMLITAGYLNFTTNQENVATSTIADRSDTAIGDAEFVSTVPHEENKTEENVVSENNENNTTNETNSEQENIIETNATEQKQEALKKINSINNTKNAIMIAENLIIAKEFENVVIFANEGSISVVVKAEELKPEEVAQIQNIVSRELNAGAEIIHISNK